MCMKTCTSLATAWAENSPADIIFSKHATTGDGILTSLKVMEVMTGEKGKPCKAGIRSGDLSPGSEKCPGT